MRQVLRIVLGLWVAAAGACAHATESPCPREPLRIAFTDRDAPPFLTGSGSEIDPAQPGWLVDEVRGALRRLGCEGQLQRLPVRRLQAELNAGRLDVGIGLGDTAERLRQWQFPLRADGRLDRRLAIGVSPVSWVTLARRQAALQQAWQAGRLVGRLGAATGSATAALTQEMGFKVEPVFEVAKVAQLLELDRFDAIALPVESYSQLLKDAGDRLAVLQPQIRTQHYYAPTSRAFFQAHPALVRRFWDALCVEVRKRPSAPACPKD